MDANDLVGNGIAVEATGNGGASTFPANGTTMVRVSGGNILDNTQAYHMDSTGLRQSGACNGSNIFLRGNSHTVGTGTYLTVSGASDYNAGCAGPPQSFTIDGYSPPTP
jgi:hypothetical protein